MNKLTLLNNKDWKEIVRLSSLKDILIIEQIARWETDNRKRVDAVCLVKEQAELLREFLNKNVKKMK
jgi:hypothetical protein